MVRAWIPMTLMLMAACVLALSPPALGQDRQQQNQDRMQAQREGTQQRQQTGQAFQPEVKQLADLMGNQVRNSQGEDLGTIDDIVLTSDKNQISYAVVSFGGVLGIGQKYFAVPWEAMELQQDDSFVLDVQRSQFEQAEGLDRDNWPDQGDQRWAGAAGGRTQMQQNQQRQDQQRESARAGARAQASARDSRIRACPVAAGAGTRQNFRMRRVSHLMGLDVKNVQDDKLGDLEDIVIDTREGRPIFGILSFGGVLGVGEQRAAVPWTELNFRSEQNIVQLDADQKTIEQIAYDADQTPDFSSREYSERIYTQFNAVPYWDVYGYVDTQEDSPQQQQQRLQAWRQDGEYVKRFDTNQLTTIQGTIESVGTYCPAPQAAPGLRLRVRTQEGQTVTVLAGPRDHARSQGINFSQGDQVNITGSKTEIQGRSVIMASQLQKGDQTLRLFDSQGRPQWDADKLMQQQDRQTGERQQQRQQQDQQRQQQS